ncbi:CinA family protein [Varunaivibrio sulfuroxidans]|uniref:Nicotinamide-nucleotide amidase n=1 Tax=Varunaivibrio sulfuroxidans TaxID=1773489 RepID=A0A4R3JG74_9PROT|nr:CinA family protein [Varunaivibrio sulfuroxidans]TCS64206.1 nicotinamide-nucleotide amidase [Varunaivibrio sulfuroxidans]WES31350.1 CinA family protein [Varunaivibrio sulfuroxidans]
MFDKDVIELGARTLTACRAGGLHAATAESCTGGLICALLSAVPGSSDVLERGFVTYANRAKTEMLGVPMELIERHGAVSEDVARAMAEGVLAHSPADISVAVTGIAGPGGGTPDKPVGLVHIAAARTGFQTRHRRFVFEGDRHQVRLAAVRAALEMVLSLAGEEG